MNTPHEPLTPDHAAVESLAREVLARDGQDIAAVLAARPGIESQTLARAVIELTAQLDAERFAHAHAAAKVKRMEALAEGMERESGIRRERGDYPNVMGVSAGDLRRVLNGGGQ